MLQDWKTVITDSMRNPKDKGGCSVILLVIAMSYFIYKLHDFGLAW